MRWTPLRYPVSYVSGWAMVHSACPRHTTRNLVCSCFQPCLISAEPLAPPRLVVRLRGLLSEITARLRLPLISTSASHPALVHPSISPLH
jgi:hypothetical protein